MNYASLRHALETNISGLLGDKLTQVDDGHGIHRDVYRINTTEFGAAYKGAVVKFGKRKDGVRANMYEFRTWMAVKGTDIEQWFCPIRDRSEDYTFLVMDYAEPVSGINPEEAEQIRRILDDRTTLEKPPNDQLNMDLGTGNVARHPSRGLVVIDYPWGSDFEIQPPTDTL